MARKQVGTPRGRRPSAQSESDPTEKPFTPETLDRTTIAIPLLDRIEREGVDKIQNVIIDVNLEYPGGRRKAREDVWEWIEALPGVIPTRDSAAAAGRSTVSPARAADESKQQSVNRSKSLYSQQYLFGQLSGANIRELVRRNEQARKALEPAQGALGSSAIYRIWLDHHVKRLTHLFTSTDKGRAARNSFGAPCKDIRCAVG